MKRLYIFFIVIFLFYAFVIISAPVLAADSKFITGIKTTGQGAGYEGVIDDESDALNFLAVMLGQAVTPIFMGVAGMISFAYGGYKWMMARGNEQDVELAKTIIINTIIAMVVAFSAYAIVILVAGKIVAPTLGSSGL
jgi:hypothetical protein